MGNGIQVGDYVSINDNRSSVRNGVIRNICRNCVFLYDAIYLERSNGIFAEKKNNVTLKGFENF
jgi:hypothetical protein